VAEKISNLEQEMVALKQNWKNEAQDPGPKSVPPTAPRTAGRELQVEPTSMASEEPVTSEAYRGVPGLGSGEFHLPIFDENTGVNPVSHLRQLQEFLQIRGIPRGHWLAVAKRSIGRAMSKQWIEDTQCKFPTVEQFKTELLDTCWSPA
jgi:hypothetical protein